MQIIINTHPKQWILNNYKRDFSYLVLPSFFTIFLSFFIPSENFFMDSFYFLSFTSSTVVMFTSLFLELMPILKREILQRCIGYGALIAYSLQKTDTKKYLNFKQTLVLFAGIAVLAGTFEFQIEGLIEPLMLGVTSTNHIFLSIIAAIYLTPLFCHYFFDAFIWKSTHWEASLIYS